MNTVLIVDDNLDSREMCCQLIKSTGIEVSSVSSGLEALKILEKNKNISVVIMDLSMPIMDGLATIEEIRANEEFLHPDRKPVEIVVLTGTDIENADLRIAARSEVREIIQKGTDKLLELPKIVKRLINQWNIKSPGL